LASVLASVCALALCVPASANNRPGAAPTAGAAAADTQAQVARTKTADAQAQVAQTATADAKVVRTAAASLPALPRVAHAAGAAAAGLETHMSHELRLAGSAAGAYVYDMTTGQALFSARAEVQRAPASVEKLYTAATALERMGPTAQLETTVLGVGHMATGGVWDGSLYLRGGGDPTFGSEAFIRSHYGGVGTAVSTLASQLAHTDGIRRVTGRVDGDESYFDSLRGEPSSRYAWDPYLEGTLSALAFNRGETGSEKGAHAPAAFAARQLRAALRAAGVAVPGGGEAASTPAGAVKLAGARSPTIAQLLGLTLPPSDNFFAETLLKDLGALYGGAGNATPDTTTPGAGSATPGGATPGSATSGGATPNGTNSSGESSGEATPGGAATGGASSGGAAPQTATDNPTTPAGGAAPGVAIIQAITPTSTAADLQPVAADLVTPAANHLTPVTDDLITPAANHLTPVAGHLITPAATYLAPMTDDPITAAANNLTSAAEDLTPVVGTTAMGAKVVRETVAELGVHPRVVDGSGLSRENQTSPYEVVTLLNALTHTAVGSVLRGDMAVAGHTGTLSERMRGTAAAGRCDGKTGTLTGVSNLVGYCKAANGDELAFAFFTDGIALGTAHTLQDNMTVTLANYR
jgi:D-alanyl-D-alanine carboxypeptidase